MNRITVLIVLLFTMSNLVPVFAQEKQVDLLSEEMIGVDISSGTGTGPEINGLDVSSSETKKPTSKEDSLWNRLSIGGGVGFGGWSYGYSSPFFGAGFYAYSLTLHKYFSAIYLWKAIPTFLRLFPRIETEGLITSTWGTLGILNAGKRAYQSDNISISLSSLLYFYKWIYLGIGIEFDYINVYWYKFNKTEIFNYNSYINSIAGLIKLGLVQKISKSLSITEEIIVRKINFINVNDLIIDLSGWSVGIGLKYQIGGKPNEH